jgi:hypothetical protein
MFTFYTGYYIRITLTKKIKNSLGEIRNEGKFTEYFDKENFGQLQLNPFTSFSAKEGSKLNPDKKHTHTPTVPKLPISYF